MINDHVRHCPVRRLDREARPKDLLITGEHGGRSAVYRFYGQDRRALYIGVSTSLSERVKDHRLYSRWWPLAEFIAVSCYSTNEAAAEAEAAAIKAERPAFNRAGRKPRERMEFRFDAGAERIAAELHRVASPELVGELARLLGAPELFPQPLPPPAPAFPES